MHGLWSWISDENRAVIVDFICRELKVGGVLYISYLASPVTGGGITVGRFQQLFLLAMSQGKKQPAEWAQFVWQVLTLQGQRIVKEGKQMWPRPSRGPENSP